MRSSGILLTAILALLGSLATSLAVQAQPADPLRSFAPLAGTWLGQGKWPDGTALSVEQKYYWGPTKRALHFETYDLTGAARALLYEGLIYFDTKRGKVVQLNIKPTGEATEYEVEKSDSTGFEVHSANTRSIVRYIGEDELRWELRVPQGGQWNLIMSAVYRRSSATSASAACPGGSCIQVGSFNIKYLGGEEDKRSEAEIGKIADLISRDLDLEVIVLQEINTKSEQWAWLRKRLAASGYDFFEGATSERNQFVVIAWDRDEVALEPGSNQPLDLPSAYQDPADPACAYQGLRVPIAARLKAGKFDFWVVGVHLKSRSHVAGASLTCAAWIREQQAAQLARAVGELMAKSKDEDVLIVGDFNEHADHDSLRPLRMAGFQSQMARRQEGSGSCSFLPACLDDDLVDHVWAQLWQTRELVRGSGFVYVPPDAAAFEKDISDHVPVWASFRTD